MEFGLSEEQAELASTLRTLLSKRADSAAARAAAESPSGYDADLWRLLCEQIGVTALAVPEEHDGAGFSLFETMIALEEIGRSLAPSPLLATLVATEALLAGAEPEHAARLLPRLAAGEIATLAHGFEAVDVLDGDRADVLLVLDGDDLFEVDPALATITWTPSVDQSLRLSRVQAPREHAVRIGDGAAARERAALAGACGVAVLAAGAAARGLEMTVAYTKVRVQFGRPIGSFQALKHRMADMLVVADQARSAGWAAAYALAVGAPNAAHLVHCAKAYCTEALALVAAETVQLHGGIAITWEHDAQRLFKRSHALGQLFGSAAEHRAHITL